VNSTDVRHLLLPEQTICGNRCSGRNYLAAYKTPPPVDKNPLKARRVDIIGTADSDVLCDLFGISLTGF
jgi:hypothetical protein